MKKRFPLVFESYNLLERPFYKAWNEGKLTKRQLAIYADHYGIFIELVARGWDTLGEKKIALEESSHYGLWKKFQKSLEVNERLPFVEEIYELVSVTQRNFAQPDSAIGALYAFEAQQPATSSSKLSGLRQHYSDWDVNEEYFLAHVGDFSEPALLEQKYENLSATRKIIAAGACKQTCEMLWHALSGIMREGGMS